MGKGRAAADPPLRAPSFFSRVSARSSGIRGSREGAVVLKKPILKKIGSQSTTASQATEQGVKLFLISALTGVRTTILC